MNLRIAFPFGNLPISGVDDDSALSILEAIFGYAKLEGYDLGLFEEALIQNMATLVHRDYAASCLVRALLERARGLRAETGLPGDLGYRREAVRVAGRIFGSPSGRTIRGDGPLVERFVREGTVRAEVHPADMVVTGAVPTGDGAIAGGAPIPSKLPVSEDLSDTLAFEIGASVPSARYRFTLAELDALSAKSVASAYPRGFRDTLAEEASAVVHDVREKLSRDPVTSAMKAIDGIQDGAAPAREIGSARFARLAGKCFLGFEDSNRGAVDPMARAEVARVRIVSDFLTEVVAFKSRVRARRAGRSDS